MSPIDRIDRNRRRLHNYRSALEIIARENQQLMVPKQCRLEGANPGTDVAKKKSEQMCCPATNCCKRLLVDVALCLMSPKKLQGNAEATEVEPRGNKETNFARPRADVALYSRFDPAALLCASMLQSSF